MREALSPPLLVSFGTNGLQHSSCSGCLDGIKQRVSEGAETGESLRKQGTIRASI